MYIVKIFCRFLNNSLLQNSRMFVKHNFSYGVYFHEFEVLLGLVRLRRGSLTGP